MRKYFIFILLLILSSSFVFATDFTTNNKLFFSFDNSDLSGSDPLDSSTYSNDGVNNGATTGVTGKSYEAFSFDGTNDYVNADPLVNDISTDTTGTIACWVNLDVNDVQQVIFSVGDTDAGTNFEMKVSDTGLIDVGFRSLGTNQWFVDTDASSTTTGSWHLIGVTQDGTTPIIYYDNTKPAQTFYVSTDKTFWFNDGSGFDNARVGDRNYNNNGEITYLQGDIDSCAYWNYALTQTEFTEYYNTNAIDPYDVGPAPKTYFTIYAKTNKTQTSLNDFSAVMYSNNQTFTGSTTNGTIYFDIPLNDYTLNVSAPNYATKSTTLYNVNNSNVTTSYLYENNSIWVNVYDGKTFDLLNQTINIVFNGLTTSYYSEHSTSNGTLQVDNLDANQYEINFFNDNYPEQKYYVTLQDNEHQDLNVYIINSTYVSSTTIKVIDPYGENIENALISMQELISGSYQTISQKYTDATGQSLFYLKIGTTYKTILDKTGYVTQTASVTPTSNPYSVTLKLTPVTTYNYTLPLDCVSLFQTSPESSYLSQELINFSLYVSSPDSKINWAGVYYNSSKLVNITGSPSGSTSNLELNISDVSGSFIVMYFIDCDGYDTYFYNKTFFASNINETNSSLNSSLITLSNSSNFLQKLSIVMIAIIVLLMISYEIGLPTKSYPFLIIILLSIFTLPAINLIPVMLTIIISLMLGISSIANWREGGFYG